MASAAGRARGAQLLDGLCDVLRDPVNAITPLFTAADSTADMHAFRFAPPP
jgi:putative ATP-dependent endonuclease of the OLD family